VPLATDSVRRFHFTFDSPTIAADGRFTSAVFTAHTCAMAEEPTGPAKEMCTCHRLHDHIRAMERRVPTCLIARHPFKSGRLVGRGYPPRCQFGMCKGHLIFTSRFPAAPLDYYTFPVIPTNPDPDGTIVLSCWLSKFNPEMIPLPEIWLICNI
jgi:hypothetical protein